MDRKLVIKIFKIRKKSKNNVSKMIVVGYNTSKVNGGYIEKLGSVGTTAGKIDWELNIKTQIICTINLRRLGYWLSRGARLKSKVSWLIGLLTYNDKEC